AAAKRAIALEPDNWRHHLRLAYVAWGEERLRAAHRTTALLPDFPLARWLAATVYVARQAVDEAEHELDAALRVLDGAPDQDRFTPVAVYWLRGLLWLARGDQAAAASAFERELAACSRAHLYGRECAANTWFAIGAMHLHNGDRRLARDAL